MSKQLRFSFSPSSKIKHFSSILSKKEKFTLYFSVFVLLTSLIAWAVYFYIDSTEIIPAVGGEYTEGIIGQPHFVNPNLSHVNEIDAILCELIFSSLMTYDNQGNLIPDLAENYDISEDQKTYTFHIKKNVKWHDGVDLKAQDIAFTISLIQNQAYQSSTQLRTDWQDIKVFTEDDYTVKFELPEGYAPFINRTTFGILPKHIFEEVTPDKFTLNDFNLEPVGSGPFEYSRFEKDSEDNIISYQLLTNNEYYGKVPYLQQITFNFYDDEDLLFDAYDKKEINSFGIISYDKVGSFEERKDTKIHRIDLSRYFGIFTNQTKSVPLADKKVRKALQYATDKERVIQEVFHGYATKVSSPLLETFSQFTPNQQKSVNEYNSGEAEKILDEAGWTKGEDGIRRKDAQPLEITLIIANWDATLQTAELIKSQWEAVGAKLNINPLEVNDMKQNFIKPREYDAILFGQEYLGGDPDPYIFWHSSGKKDPGFNIAVYDNEEVDKILEEARKKNNTEERKEFHRQFEEKLAEDAPAIFLYSPQYVFIANSKIKGIDTTSAVNPSYRYTDVQNWYIKTARQKKQNN